MNLHTNKYSGLANSKVLNIHATADGSVSITKVKADATSHSVRPGSYRLR